MRTAPLFSLGRCVSTAGAAAVLKPDQALELLTRHQHGDWGCLDPMMFDANDEAITIGNRILSAYPIDPDRPCKGFGANCLWIITEGDRSVTTILLPEEY